MKDPQMGKTFAQHSAQYPPNFSHQSRGLLMSTQAHEPPPPPIKVSVTEGSPSVAEVVFARSLARVVVIDRSWAERCGVSLADLVGFAH